MSVRGGSRIWAYGLGFRILPLPVYRTQNPCHRTQDHVRKLSSHVNMPDTCTLFLPLSDNYFSFWDLPQPPHLLVKFLFLWGSTCQIFRIFWQVFSEFHKSEFSTTISQNSYKFLPFTLLLAKFSHTLKSKSWSQLLTLAHWFPFLQFILLFTKISHALRLDPSFWY